MLQESLYLLGTFKLLSIFWGLTYLHDMCEVGTNAEIKVGERPMDDQSSDGGLLVEFGLQSLGQGTMNHVPFHQMLGDVKQKGGVHPVSLSEELGKYVDLLTMESDPFDLQWHQLWHYHAYVCL